MSSTIDPNLIKIVSIIGIVVLMGIALFKGIDGALLASGFAFIAGIAGYEIGKSQGQKQVAIKSRQNTRE